MSQAKWVWYFGNFKLSETVVVSWIIIAALYYNKWTAGYDVVDNDIG